MQKKTEQKQAQTGTVHQLLDDLKSEDLRKRINSINNLSLIAQAIGPDRTRNELLKFVQDEVLDDEDEVLMALVNTLNQPAFLELIGGSQFSPSLFGILESLCKSEESAIREKASLTFKQLISFIDVKKYEDVLVKSIKRLNENGYYYAKHSVSFLIPALYKNIQIENQAELLKIYQKYLTDSKPSVRKYASQNMQYFVQLHPTIPEQTLIQMLDPMIKDEQDFVRLYSIDTIIMLLKANIQSQNLVSNFLKILTNDKSWRIKYYLCERIGDIIQAMNKETFKTVILVEYIKYLEDQEAELRSIAASKLTEVTQTMSQNEILEQLMPIIKNMTTDSQNYVRIQLAGSVLTICSTIGKAKTTDHILPIFLQLLKDEDSDVRINLFKKLNEITKVLGLDTLSQSVIPALTTLATDKNWRIRCSSIEIISFFAKEIGKEFLNEKIIAILMQWIQDKVFQVREKAIECVKDLIKYLGSNWTETNVLPKVLTSLLVPNYLYRQTKIADELNEDYLHRTILPVIVQLSKDPVPNVRMNVCRSISQSHKFFRDKETLKKILQTLNEDIDADVKYYCMTAIDSF